MSEAQIGWSRHFDETIPLPDGRELKTLLDAGRYVETLSKATHNRPEWQIATEMLLMAAEGRLPLMFAHVALLKALNRSAPPRGREPRR